MKIRFMIIVMIHCFFGINAEWAQRFHKKLMAKELQNVLQQNNVIFSKTGISLFSQLLLSWNALRPPKGHFTFYVQARNAHTKRWGKWHRMCEWGADVQRSYLTKSDGFTKCVHVRLETEPLFLADGFHVKAVGAKGARLNLLKNMTITTTNMREFRSESIGAIKKLATVSVEKVPKLSQISLDHSDKRKMCSPVSCAMLTEFMNKKSINPLTFATKSYDKGLKAYGSWPFNMAYAFESSSGTHRFFNTRLDSFRDIHKQLQKGIPVAVSVRGSLHGAPQSYPQGHFLLVVGYDNKSQEIVCHDPAKWGDKNVEQRYALKDFLRGWEASRRLTYLVELI